MPACAQCLEALVQWIPKDTEGNNVSIPVCNLGSSSVSSKCIQCLKEDKNCTALHGSGRKAFRQLSSLLPGQWEEPCGGFYDRVYQAELQSALERAQRYLKRTKEQSPNPVADSAAAAAAKDTATSAVLRAAAIAHTEIMIDIARYTRVIAECQRARLTVAQQKEVHELGYSVGPSYLPSFLLEFKEESGDESEDDEEEENEENE
ncbi:hypothetical protein B0I35DRAFT_484393 [Stachybotrys elegans]|uniref:Uncharacterized protein n=1 Tax=Stachybotrys elegans TaxID=80388 RepID=A0A8K0WJP1_9HYPO|nr:hypothetical protein B0I35DRAFT_484393 [Stachybotrys elegans]